MSHPADISDFKPTSLSHLIGQRKVIDQVVVALDAAQQDSKRFDHAMLTGPPGLGKSALAYVIAQEMATGFCEILGQSLNSLADLNAVLLSAKHRDVVFIDECHEIRREFQTTLYRVLDTQCVSVKTNGPPQPIPVANFTLLLATTDEFCLLQPLRDRMRLVLRLDFLSAPELIVVVQQRCRALGWDVDESVLPEIARIVRKHGLDYQGWRYIANKVRQKCDLRPAKKGRKLPRIMTADDFRRFYQVVDQADDVQHALMLRLVFYTAVRVGELCRIEVADIDLENCKIRIEQGKGGKDRFVLFGKSFATALRTHIAAHPDKRRGKPRRLLTQPREEARQKLLAARRKGP